MKYLVVRMSIYWTLKAVDDAEIQRWQHKIDSGEYLLFNSQQEAQQKVDELNFQVDVIQKARNGQETENAIELNDAVKYYVSKLIRDNDFLIKSDLYVIALDNTNVSKQTKYQNDMKTRKAYTRMLDNVEQFERSIAIATNSDPSHPVDWIKENDFVNILSHMAVDDKERYGEVAKLLNVEATYEPKALKDEYIKLQQIVNNHISHPAPAIDGNTLAGEMPVNAGGTQGT